MQGYYRKKVSQFVHGSIYYKYLDYRRVYRPEMKVRTFTTSSKKNNNFNDKEDNRYLFQIPPWFQKADDCVKPGGFHNENEVTIKEKGNCKSVYMLKKCHRPTNRVEISNNKSNENCNINDCIDYNNMKEQLNNETNQAKMYGDSLPKNTKVCEDKINILNRNSALTHLIHKHNEGQKNEPDATQDEFNWYANKISLVKQRQKELSHLKERRNKLLHNAFQGENMARLKDEPKSNTFLRVRDGSDLLRKTQTSDLKLSTGSDINKETKKQNKQVRKLIVRKSIFIPKSSAVTNKSVQVERKRMKEIDSSELENDENTENTVKITMKQKEKQIVTGVKPTTNKLIIEVASKPVKLSSKELLYSGKKNPGTAANNTNNTIGMKGRISQDIDAIEKKKALKPSVSAYALKHSVAVQKKPTSNYKSDNLNEGNTNSSNIKIERKSQSLISLGLSQNTLDKYKKNSIDNIKRDGMKPMNENLMFDYTNKNVIPLKVEKSGFKFTNKSINNRSSPNSSKDNKNKSTKLVIKIADNPSEEIKARPKFPEKSNLDNKLLQYYRVHNNNAKQEQKSVDTTKDGKYSDNKISDNKQIVSDEKKKQNLTNNSAKIQSEGVEKMKNVVNSLVTKPVSMPFPPSSQMPPVTFSSIAVSPQTAHQLKSLPSVSKSLSLSNQTLSKKQFQKSDPGQLKPIMVTYPTKKDSTRRNEVNNNLKLLPSLAHKTTNSYPVLHGQTTVCSSPSPILCSLNPKVNKSPDPKLKFTLPKHRSTIIHLNKDQPKQRSNASRAVKDLIKSEVSPSTANIPSRLIIPGLNCRTIFDNSFAKQAKTSFSLSEPLKSDAYILPPTLHNNLLETCTTNLPSNQIVTPTIDNIKDPGISANFSCQEVRQSQNSLPERINSGQTDTSKDNLKPALLDFQMMGTSKNESGNAIGANVTPTENCLPLDTITGTQSPSTTAQYAITEGKAQQSNQLRVATKSETCQVSLGEPRTQGLTTDVYNSTVDSNNQATDSHIDLKNKHFVINTVNSNEKSKDERSTTSETRIVTFAHKRNALESKFISKQSPLLKQYITNMAQLIMEKYRTIPAQVKCCLKTAMRNYHMNEKIKLERERNELKLPLIPKTKIRRYPPTLHTKMNLITQTPLKKQREVNFKPKVLRAPKYRNNPYLSANKKSFYKTIKIRRKPIDVTMQTKLGTLKKNKKKIALVKQNPSTLAPTMAYSEVLSIIFGEKKKPHTSKMEK